MTGCYRSLKATPRKAEESMTTADAMQFPVVRGIPL